MKSFEVPIFLEERQGIARSGQAVRVGVPLPRGQLPESGLAVVTDSEGRTIPHQLRPLAHWPDRTVKWLLVDALVDLAPGERSTVHLRSLSASQQHGWPAPAPLVVVEQGDSIEIDTGAARFVVDRHGAGPIAAALLESTNQLGAAGARIRLRDQHGECTPRIERVVIEESGPIRAAIVMEGGFHRGRSRVPLRFKSRSVFTAGSAALEIEFQIHNPQAARHLGGLWDLGDAGSWIFEDLSLELTPSAPIRQLSWYAESSGEARNLDAVDWALYQDSSGGENWNSDNHLDRSGQSTVTFPGYQVRGGGTVLAEGLRASPCLTLIGNGAWIAASVKDFWQNFPKAIRCRDGACSVGLFPGESRGSFELQGGERKRHTVFLDFGRAGRETVMPQLQHPIVAWPDSAHVEASGAISYFVARLGESDARYASYIENVVAGEDSFFAKREIIDEYGWRNFGDLYADHEAVNHRGPRPFVSHYNNQYDFIYGALAHFLRTGDCRWRQLMEDAARHTIDIDIYHTNEDKAAFNGGLFWHTDHYKPAATSTHRTYSRRNSDGGGYGGGPSNEHNYTSGLLHYYYLTGDAEAAEAVLLLADWVMAMDDGSKSILSLLDTGPTGDASKTVDSGYHKPGRGSANSINALLDAYALSRKRSYMQKAEELVQRCIHPRDDIESLGLRDPERRWSYLVFLQVLGKLIDQKVEWGETDYVFHYARESLLHYARWMVANEVPYKQVLHKVDIPTETWPAHDIRKCHILYVAAKYAPAEEREDLRRRAAYFYEQCLTDLLSFPTATLTRPMVILSVYGYVHAYFQRYDHAAVFPQAHDYAFGEPVSFTPQRHRLLRELRARLSISTQESLRLIKARVGTWRNSSGRS